MFYIDEIYQENSPNCYTLSLKTSTDTIPIGKCYIDKNIQLASNYEYENKDQRTLIQAFMDGATQSFKNGEYMAGQVNATIGGITGNKSQAQKGQQQIAHGVTPTWKEYNNTPVFSHSEVTITLPELNFVFVNKADDTKMLQDVENFLNLVTGAGVTIQMEQKKVESKKLNTDTKENIETIEQIVYKGSNWASRGGVQYMDKKGVFHSDGKGFVLKAGKYTLDRLYTKQCAVSYSLDTDLEGRPHSVTIKLVLQLVKKYWPKHLLETNRQFM